jgi:hypothetical protein
MSAATKKYPLNRWGLMRKNYLQDHCPEVYNELRREGKFLSHCYEIEQQANERMQFMMKQMVERFPISEDLKNTDPLAWVGHMNGLKAQVEEVIRADLIYC